MRSTNPLRRFVLACIFLSTVSLSVWGVGVKRRIADADAAEAAAASAAEPAAAISEPANRYRRTGGVNRRIAEAAAEPAGDPESSSSAGLTDPIRFPFTAALKRDWAKGTISAATVQDYAMKAMLQGAEGLQDIARMGGGGAHPQNMQRALIGLLGTPHGAPEFHWAEIPTTKGRKEPHPFLLPHLFFESFFHGRKSEFISAVRGPPRSSAQFWNAIKDQDYYQHHPRRDTQNWARTVPLGLHGDAGAFSKQDSLMVVSWNSLLGSGATIAKRFLITAIPKSQMVPGTMDAVLRLVAWSFNILLDGLSPSHNFNGVPILGAARKLADGWCGALCQIRGDWQFFTDVFHFPAWNNAAHMCWLCQASSTVAGLEFSDCRLRAGWRHTLFTHESYLGYLLVNVFPIPILFLLVGGVIGLRLSCFMIDVLHAVDQGVSSHIIGNILWYAAIHKNFFGGPNMQEKVLRLYADIKRWYSETHCEYKLQGKLTVERLRETSQSWPKLKAKAAATRKLAAYALDLAQRFCDGSDIENTMVAICAMLCRFYEILESESQFLSRAARDELPSLGQSLAEQYSKLSIFSIWSSGYSKFLRNSICGSICASTLLLRMVIHVITGHTLMRTW